MIWRFTDEVKPKYYLNGFPKSGLHLLVLMMAPLLDGQPPSPFFANHWIGTFNLNAWGGEWLDLKPNFYRLAELQGGNMLKGHSGHRADLADFMQKAGICHIFIYRDLRDVAVSAAHHIMSPDDRNFKHPAKEAFRGLGGFDEVLAAVITGLGPFPGVIERWQKYAGWLTEDWICAVRFEDILQDRAHAAAQLLSYGIRRTMEFCPWPWQAEDDWINQAVGAMVRASRRTQLSPNFRQGTAQAWEDSFKQRHKDLFKETDAARWLTRLGYAENNNW